jgi:antitoxin (DNA-binding transcriptional repressor) of toxin-antitoxin stability system
MRAVGLEVLKNKLSEYVRLAAGGETVLVTIRNQVVAEIGPPQPSRALPLPDAQLAELIRRGVLTPASMPCAGPPPSVPVLGVTVASLVDELTANRAER